MAPPASWVATSRSIGTVNAAGCWPFALRPRRHSSARLWQLTHRPVATMTRKSLRPHRTQKSRASCAGASHPPAWSRPTSQPWHAEPGRARSHRAPQAAGDKLARNRSQSKTGAGAQSARRYMGRQGSISRPSASPVRAGRATHQAPKYGPEKRPAPAPADAPGQKCRQAQPPPAASTRAPGAGCDSAPGAGRRSMGRASGWQRDCSCRPSCHHDSP